MISSFWHIFSNRVKLHFKEVYKLIDKHEAMLTYNKLNEKQIKALKYVVNVAENVFYANHFHWEIYLKDTVDFRNQDEIYLKIKLFSNKKYNFFQ